MTRGCRGRVQCQGADQRHGKNRQSCRSHVGLHCACAVEDSCNRLFAILPNGGNSKDLD
jgi:hypothetical protein